MDAPRAGPPTMPATIGSRTMMSGWTPPDPEVEHQRLLHDDEEEDHQADPGHVPCRQSTARRSRAVRAPAPGHEDGPQSTTDTYRRWLRSASGSRVTDSCEAVTPVFEATTLATGMPAGIAGPLEPAGGEDLARR